MNMKTLLFVMLPTPSHYITSFPLAHEFEKNGFKVTFTGNADSIKVLVKQNGFVYENMLYETTEGILIYALKKRRLRLVR